MAKDVGAHLTELFWSRDVPGHIRSYQRPVFTSRRIRRWLSKLGMRTLFIETRSPRENGYIESFNGKLRDEHLKREILYTLQEAQVLVERWRDEHTRRRSPSSLGHCPPASEACLAHRMGYPRNA